MPTDGTLFQGFSVLLTIATVAFAFTKASGFLQWMPLQLDGVVMESTNDELRVREISWREKPYETATRYIFGGLLIMGSTWAAAWIWSQISSNPNAASGSFVERSMLWLFAYVVIVPLFLWGASEAFFTQTVVVTRGSVVWHLVFAGFVIKTALNLMSNDDAVSVFRRSDARLAHYWVDLKRSGRQRTIAGCRDPEIAKQFARKIAEAVGCSLVDKTESPTLSLGDVNRLAMTATTPSPS